MKVRWWWTTTLIARRLVEASLRKAGVRAGGGHYRRRSMRFCILEQPGQLPRLIVLDLAHAASGRPRRVPGDPDEIRKEPYLCARPAVDRQRSPRRSGRRARMPAADDYVTKPCNLFELRARLRAGERILELQDQLVEAREQLREQATHDPLTGLLSRAALLDTLQRESRASEPRARRRGRHHGGRRQLQSDQRHARTHGWRRGAARSRPTHARGRSHLRFDRARYGGEEFVVVAPGCGAAIARELAERLAVESVCSGEITGADTSLAMTVSLGVASSATPTARPMRLLRAADRALYQAKANGNTATASSSIPRPAGPFLFLRRARS